MRKKLNITQRCKERDGKQCQKGHSGRDIVDKFVVCNTSAKEAMEENKQQWQKRIDFCNDWDMNTLLSVGLFSMKAVNTGKVVKDEVGRFNELI